MNTPDFKRKLSAVFSADVAGYSRLMGEDEAATVKTLEDYKQVMFSLIKQHRGRVIDSPGDNLLAEFASVVDAVQCGVAVQKELQARNAELPENRKMQFRIGINLGDVIEEQDRIYGDGVNIAARLESCADPGGICVSKTAFDHIETKLPLGYEYLGEKEVKNIAKPVGAYRVLMEPRVTVAGAKEKKPSIPVWRTKGVFASAATVLVVIIGLAVWNFYWRAPKIEPASKEKMALPLPDLPSIAVMPFANMSGDPKQEYLSDGITESIITAISKIHNLFVIARNSTSTYKGKPVKVQQVAEDLGVQYVLEGSVQRSSDRLRVTAQLIDALNGSHIWAQRYDRELKDLFAVQDSITMEILQAMRVKLTEGHQVFWAKRPKNIESALRAYEAHGYILAFTPEANDKGRKLAEEVIAMDPDWGEGHYILSEAHMMDVWLGTAKSPQESIDKAIALSEKAVALDDSLAQALALIGYLYGMKREYDKSVAYAEKAVEKDPNGADAHAWLGNCLNFAAKPQEAIPHYDKAMRLNPRPQLWYHIQLGQSYRMLGRYDEAVAQIKKSLALSPNSTASYAHLIFTYAAMGREDLARTAGAELLKINPKFSAEKYADALPHKDRDYCMRWGEALRKALLTQTPPLPLPDKPSIAVLPFVNMSDDKNQEYFSDGLTEEIITALSKTPQIFVIASNTTFTYKGKPVKVRQVSEELGVRYVLEGSVRRGGERVRITAQLIDALKGYHLWAESYDRELKDLFSVQDDITKNIITAVHVKLTDGERARIFAKGTSNLNAYLKTAEAAWYTSQSTKEGVLRAQQLAEEAIALDPNYPHAHMTLGAVHGAMIWLGMTQSPRDTMKRCIELIEKAIALDDSFGEAHATLGYWLILARQYDRGVSEGERGMALEPNSDRVLQHYAATLMFVGRREEAIPLFREALRLNPKPPNLYYRQFGACLRDTGRYEEAIAVSKKAIEQEPKDTISYMVLASSCQLAGREEEAREAAKELLRINPAFSLERLAQTTPHKDRAVADRFIEALRKAGLK